MSGRDKVKCNQLFLERQLEESGSLYILHIKHWSTFFDMHLCVSANPVFRQCRDLDIYTMCGLKYFIKHH